MTASFLAVSAGDLDLARLLADLLIVIVAAKIGGELAERARVPAVLGEILAGVLVGPSVFGLIEFGGSGPRDVSLAIIAEIGVLLLLLGVGLEMDLGELRRVGGTAMSVAIIGVAVPFAAGYGVGRAFGESANTALFFGAALTATSVGITARVLGDLRVLATKEARVVLGAAVADDVLGLVILTVVVKVVTGGDIGLGTVAETLGLAAIFLVGTAALAVWVAPPVFAAIHRRATSGATVLVAAFALMIGFATLADQAKLAFIIGAFMAGLALGRTAHHERIADELGAVSHIFVPVFFVTVGAQADLDAMFQPSVLGLAAAMTGVAIVGKLLAGLGARGSSADRLLIGIGMVPRGEVGLIFASIGLSNAVLGPDEYGALLLVVLVTTMLTPPALRWRVARTTKAGSNDAADTPDSGGDTVLAWALQTAEESITQRPDDETLDWFAARRHAPLAWTTSHTPALVHILRSHQPRSWRFLEATGVLERALPEVAEAMHRKRADMSDLDPLGAMRFPTVERLPDSTGRGVVSDTYLAAMIADATTDRDSARQLAVRLVGERADALLALIDEAELVNRRGRESASFDPAEMAQLASRFADIASLRSTVSLAIAFGGHSEHHARRVTELGSALEAAFSAEVGVAGELHRSLVDERREAALARGAEDGASEFVLDRIRYTPASYLLTNDANELLRQATLVEPLPRPGRVRVAVTPTSDADRWRVDVAARDVDGLLATIADVLIDHGLDIQRADIATWPDGAVLDSFVAVTTQAPSADAISAACERQLQRNRRRVRPMPLVGLNVVFDNDVSPWYTVCTVEGPDRLGALRAISHALAAAGVRVHAARLEVLRDESGAARLSDRFTVSDRLDRKLDQAAMARVRSALSVR